MIHRDFSAAISQDAAFLVVSLLNKKVTVQNVRGFIAFHLTYLPAYNLDHTKL